jgi:hypothetical protein
MCMVSAHKKVTKRNRHLNMGMLLKATACVFFVLIASEAAIGGAKQSQGGPESLAGYVSQEKRFLMYLFNGNEGKVQVA